MKTPLNKKTLSQHFQYTWWLYVLSAVLCFFLWDLAFTVTAPRTPDSEKLEFYIYGYGDSDAAQAYVDRLHAAEMEDVTEMNAVFVMPDESSGLMVLATRIMAGEGDLFLLPRDSFQSYAGQGLFVALDDLEGIEEMCAEAGLNIERGWRKNQETGERHLYGIPASSFSSISSWSYATSEMYLCIRIYNGNEDNAEKFFRLLLRDGLTPSASPAAAPEAESTEPAPTADPVSAV